MPSINEISKCLLEAEDQFYRDWKDAKTPEGMDEPDASYFIDELKKQFCAKEGNKDD